MKRDKKSMNDDELVAINAKKCIHVSVGYLLRKTRMMSPLSHEEMLEKSSINRSTAWRMENRRNYSVVSCAQAFYTHFTAMKCVFHLRHLCRCIVEALLNGKHLAIEFVDTEDLPNYKAYQIIFNQEGADIGELKRRRKQTEATLAKNSKHETTKKEKGKNKKPYSKKKKGKR